MSEIPPNLSYHNGFVISGGFMSKTIHHTNTLKVRQALWDLQKEVLTSLKDIFEKEIGYQAQPAEWFNVLMTAERYIWLKELTSLMADIDVLTELEMVDEDQAAIARFEIERLIIDLETEDDFTRNYKALLLSGGSLLPLHTQLKSHLELIPKQELDANESFTKRKKWQETHREQARKKRM